MCIDTLVKAGQAVGQNIDSQAIGSRASADNATQRALQDEANQRIVALVKQTAQSNPAPYAAQAKTGYVDALRNAGLVNGGGGFTPVGAASSRYNSDVSKARGATTAANLTSADDMARIDAPAVQRQQEGIFANRARTNLANIGARSDTAAYLSKLYAAGVGG